ncbi:hypothetical protein [Myceligenerans pegani]|uniref:Uncharacterized protein n=1 Tax=Myceligenerans pegani TaxID=2776917 RepID=A0ABR9N1Q9_9MICO|nr:hypothetical protein [Myceligenerans sp. TRM 65318]MBE1876952.1 hypothetical protein [Myceligenerans sp. TRM 65318]MBE3019223.1 hypothetical protein [Myceligenerans sp. TRM 65318]
MDDMTVQRVPPGPVLDALRIYHWLPAGWDSVHPVLLEAALDLADGDPRRLRVDDDGTVAVLNRPAEPEEG